MIFWDVPLVKFLIPHGSRRQVLAQLLANAIRHPILFVSAINPTRVRNLFFVLRTQGYNGFMRNLKAALGQTEDMLKPSAELDLIPIKKREKLEDYPKLCFAKEDKPLVSVVIPVYNQFDYTYNCLASILKNSGDISYEVIVADDCSTDFTTKILDVVQGITVAKTAGNCRFLLNCNNAAKSARGQYILFLNNDTQVQPNWLEPLVRLMQEDSSIGMTGSKFIFPNGALQEAGGILFNDGSAWNYGRGMNASMPEYNYVKEVDYISGASICIRSSLWKELGGFDEAFAPAYCEDSDLAFRVRKAGYKVVYQPQSVVVHYEGCSNGTDTSCGLKSYQVVNQKKFFERWKDVLHKENFANGEQIFFARDRSRGKKTILVIDHYVPTFDKDAGSKTMLQYLKMFIAKGFNVKFVGDNYAVMQPYCSILLQMGVEVLYGAWYQKNIFSWIKANKDNIDFAYLNRPHISVKYIDFLKNKTDIKLIYYGHDLHFLRVTREYELSGDKRLKKDIARWKKAEFKIMRKVDVAYYPSEVEAEAIKKIDPSINVKAIHAYIFDTDKLLAKYLDNKREGLLFVGGFVHPPNADAVKWFASEVFPQIRKARPDIQFYIVGSNAPDEIKKMDGNGIVFKGFVSEDELRELYAHCKMVVVPLRFGAGVKGKVIEALYNGCPIVTTDTGAEGIVGVENVLEIHNGADDFAKTILDLYDDDKKLESMSAKSVDFIKNNFSMQAAWDVVKADFSSL